MEWMDHDDMPSLPFALLADRFRELDLDASADLSLPELCLALRICRASDIARPAATSQIAGKRALSKFDRTISTAVTTPVQVHLQLTVDFQTMLVSWAQDTAASASVEWDVVSRAGSGSGPYANSAAASASNYSVQASGLSYTSLPLLTGAMSPLVASEQYFYRVGNDAQGWSPEYSFVAMPDPAAKQATGNIAKIIVVGGKGRPLHNARAMVAFCLRDRCSNLALVVCLCCALALFGCRADMGTAIPMGATVCQWIEAELAAEKAYNLTLHVGDLAYASVGLLANTHTRSIARRAKHKRGDEQIRSLII